MRLSKNPLNIQKISGYLCLGLGVADLKYPVGIKDIVDCLILHIKHCVCLDLFCDFVRVEVQSILQYKTVNRLMFLLP